MGRGLDFVVVMEGFLKFKEILYIYLEVYAVGELKYGIIVLIEDGIFVIVFVIQEKFFEKMVSNIKEVKFCGVVVFFVV